MKKIYPWLSFMLAVVVCVVAIYGAVSFADMWGDDMAYSGATALGIAALVAAAVGSILLCVGAFRKSKTLGIMGSILLVGGIILLFVARAVNIAHVW